MTYSSPPAADEFELSLFGPGKGECIVLHLGDGQWIVVDSCRNPATHVPVASEYLDALGVDIARDVRQFIITHWHDDHIGGAHEFFERATGAEFVCSGALGNEEFVTLLRCGRRSLFTNTSSGVDEFRYILESLDERPGSRRIAGRGPTLARSDQRLSQLTHTSGSTSEEWALSPANATLTLAVRAFGDLVPDAGEYRNRLPTQTANELSVVLWVRVGAVTALLGGDLEQSNDPARGWTAIVSSSRRPQGRASVFKVPHHGSRDADCPDVWNALLEPSTTSLLTPFGCGRLPLPTPSDVSRLKARSSSLICTAPPGGTASIRRTRAVDRTIRETARSFRTIEGGTGQIRIRAKHGETSANLRVELFAGAVLL